MKRIVLWVLVCALFTALAGLGLLDWPDAVMSDALYQTREPTNPDIVLVGIDQRALEALGPYSSWNRDILAQAVEYLNQEEESSPAVIALDVLFVGETEPEYDEYLTQAAALRNNVVVASAAELGSSLVIEGDTFYKEEFAVNAYDEPYAKLKAVTRQGHINTLREKNGIIRYHLFRITLADGSVIPSISMEIAQMYRDYHGLPPITPPPVTKRGFWYLNFHGQPGDYDEGISIMALLLGEIPREYFTGKIVLIGPYAAGLQDSHITAIDHTRPMNGVEIQANAIQSLLESDYKRVVDEFPQLLFLFVVLLLGCAAFWRRSVRISFLVWVALVSGWIILCRAAYRHGLVLHALWIPACVTVEFLIAIIYNYAQAAIERFQITSTFKRYVAPEIVNEILKEGTESLGLGGKLCDIAVLFVDIRGFTPMSELLEPTQVVEMLNRYLTLTSSCISKHGGTLDKFIGDATMAFWGAPLPQEDYAMNAVKAALDMVEGSRQLSQELMAQYGRTLTFGIGIHLGPAVVGNIGAVNRMDYTAIGDTVNTASRLESQAPAGTIYISKAVADALAGRIRVTSLGTGIKLKGKSSELEVFVLDGLAKERPAAGKGREA